MVHYTCLKCSGPDVINSTSKKVWSRRGTEYQSSSYIDEAPASSSAPEDDSYGRGMLGSNNRTDFLRMQMLESFDTNMADSFLSADDFAMS